jgi:hypothetical protein
MVCASATRDGAELQARRAEPRIHGGGTGRHSTQDTAISMMPGAAPQRRLEGQGATDGSKREVNAYV